MHGPTTRKRTDEHAAAEPTIGERVLGAIGAERLEVALHLVNEGSLDDPRERTRRYESVADLPDDPLGGWEELVVYTETHVYRWVGVGYDVGPTRLPRDPEHVSRDPRR